MKPSSLAEAAAILQSTFQVLELQEWVYGGSPLVAEIKSAAGFIHDDDVSSIIIKALWHVLNGAPCPTIEELIPLGTTQHLAWD